MQNPLIGFFKDMIYQGLEVFGRYYSSYRAFVYSVDDPDKMQRIKLIIPELSGNKPYNYWAYAKGVFSGPGYGSQILPQVSDMVWVEFESGHPEVPIWMHGYFGKDEIPVDDEDLKDPNCFWFITPKGNKVKINDTKNYIHIRLNDGQYIEVNNNAISLVTSKQISNGTLNKSAQKSMLGDNTKDLLTDMKDYMSKLQSALDKDVKASVLSGAPYLKYTNITTTVPQLLILINSMVLKLNTILSNISTLD